MSGQHGHDDDPTGPEGLEAREDLEAIASLAEPIRRALYDFVLSASDPVTRDEAAEAVGASRSVAAYHMDRLADEGLFDVEFRRLSGRQGPGAGRPSKLYRRSDREYQVTVPPRRYDVAARILLEAMRDAQVDSDVLAEAARRTGRGLGAEGLGHALATTGYEPVTEEAETRFRNCPFQALREEDRETTCGLNLALVGGMIEGSGSDTSAVFAPDDTYCCVRLRPAIEIPG